MEVAVFMPIMRLFKCVALLALCCTILAGATGCTNILTRAEAAKSEGQRLYAEGNYSDAAGSFRDGLRQDPRDYQARFYLGQCYEQMHQYPLAFQSYHSALDTMTTTLAGRDDPEFRLKIIDALAAAVALHDPQQTELNAIETRAKSTRRAEDYFLLAKVYRQTQDADSAVASFNQAALYEPKNFAIQKEYGLYLLSLSMTSQAKEHLIKAYKLDPSDREVAGGLERCGVVPGPSLRDKSDLAKPAIPQGPGPDLSDMFNKKDAPRTPAPAPAPDSTPHD
jgi:Tfp pilus assembly protein PilF